MTPDELQELDSYLAQHIMGWLLDPIGDLFNDAGLSVYQTKPDGTDFPLWSPSSNPAQALEVAEKIQLFTQQHKLPGMSDSDWLVLCGGYPEDIGGPYAVCGAREGFNTPLASTPALAISLAAKTWHQAQQT